MTLDKLENGSFVIIRGGRNRSYFSFFVDHDRACWSKYLYNATQFKQYREAREAIAELKQRAKLKRVTVEADREQR